MKLLLLGRLAELAGWREKTAPVMATLTEVRAWAAAGDEALLTALQAPGVQAAVNKVLWREDALPDGASEIAFLPPMSGG